MGHRSCKLNTGTTHLLVITASMINAILGFYCEMCFCSSNMGHHADIRVSNQKDSSLSSLIEYYYCTIFSLVYLHKFHVAKR